MTGSSRTFKGEEIAGVSVYENAFRRISAGQGEVFLVGGALNAEREDLLLSYELGRNLWPHDYKPVWSRKADGGGFIPGSVVRFWFSNRESMRKRAGASLTRACATS